jgi:hypothetical protein
MLSVIMLNVANNPFMLSVIMLSVIMLNVVMLSAMASHLDPWVFNKGICQYLKRGPVLLKFVRP